MITQFFEARKAPRRCCASHRCSAEVACCRHAPSPPPPPAEAPRARAFTAGYRNVLGDRRPPGVGDFAAAWHGQRAAIFGSGRPSAGGGAADAAALLDAVLASASNNDDEVLDQARALTAPADRRLLARLLNQRRRRARLRAGECTDALLRSGLVTVAAGAELGAAGVIRELPVRELQEALGHRWTREQAVAAVVSASGACAFETHPALARLAAGVRVAALAPHAWAALYRATALFFLLGGHSPEDAAALWQCDVSQVPFAFRRSAPDLHGWGADEADEALAALAASDALEAAVAGGDVDRAALLLHEAVDWAQDPARGARAHADGGCVCGRCAAARWRARVVAGAVSALERERRYESALLYLELWLRRAPDGARDPLQRGPLWLRFVVDCGHLGRAGDALAAAEEALCDPLVVGEHRLDLQNHVRRLAVPPRRWRAPGPFPELTPPRVVRLRLERAEGVGVEEAVLRHYRAKGWRGAHTENSVLLALFALLCWDVLTISPTGPGLPQREAPLDLRTTGFAARVRGPLRARLAAIDAGGEGPALVRANYEAHRGEAMVGLNWGVFADADHAAAIAEGFGGRALARICELLATNYGVWHRGFADLLLWRRVDGRLRVLLSEVKGPGDSLRATQILWLHEMMAHGVEAECSVVTWAGVSSVGGEGGKAAGSKAAASKAKRP